MSWFSSFSFYIRTLAWKGVKHWIRRSFPSVPTISTAQLARWLAADPSTLPHLIDARKPEEYAVSHLLGAYRAKTIPEVDKLGISKDTPIVVYCSVGYRSARLGQALRAAGYRAINLEGSIFQWANEHRPLVTEPLVTKGSVTGSLVTGQGPPIAEGTRATHEVHPYNTFWGMLLNPNQPSASR
ncbi:rhodanese-like domain-containing protein [cf. Phormidesmis sp. LEGE 11477]|uniref:rhodanese-like domain-containing protein n=1 Tax=cf. Phormidesmis sp. LEGE 11477 TaxID=1828680 RepID=UPI001880408B|nr:rhodanese-like domain-containing protein [cf. Phormidesmis sp. LEGE 11477]MBE9063926.1 rhodanese-like domain-containing protein [cf. Phormidesmis sp. LEGE 11477]